VSGNCASGSRNSNVSAGPYGGERHPARRRLRVVAMTLRNRLILTVAGIALLLVLPALSAVQQLRQVRDIAAIHTERISRANLSLGRLQTRLAEFDRLQRVYIVEGDAESRGRMYDALTNARVHLANLGNAGFAEEVVPTGMVLDSLDHATARVDTLMVTGRTLEATALFDDVRPLFGQASDALDALAERIDAQSQAQLRQAETISAQAVATTLVALAICLVLASALGLWTTRALLGPIGRLRGAMAGVAGGDFIVPEDLPYRRADEIGDLSRSFRSMAQRLEELDRMKAEFMSIATHELKTPINVIGGYAELMQERLYGELTDKQEEALVSIREQAQVLTSLVNQLLDISRLEAGGLQLEIESISVEEILRRTERAFAPLAQRRSTRFAVNMDPSMPQTIYADSDRVRDQLLGNLLSNALKFTPDGGAIDVRAWGEDGALHVEVADTGPGIAAEQLPLIFDKFYQIGNEARRQGAGLGLAIAREVAEAHGGTIGVESEVGRGTRFHFVLPAAPAGSVADVADRQALPAAAERA
jgi:signal transduction histidine kinase